ncbi:hypothetical protein HC928_00420 [bacterium]|nr:hypothetical protein [bacterium]
MAGAQHGRIQSLTADATFSDTMRLGTEEYASQFASRFGIDLTTEADAIIAENKASQARMDLILTELANRTEAGRELVRTGQVTGAVDTLQESLAVIRALGIAIPAGDRANVDRTGGSQ